MNSTAIDQCTVKRNESTGKVYAISVKRADGYIVYENVPHTSVWKAIDSGMSAVGATRLHRSLVDEVVKAVLYVEHDPQNDWADVFIHNPDGTVLRLYERVPRDFATGYAAGRSAGEGPKMTIRCTYCQEGMARI